MTTNTATAAATSTGTTLQDARAELVATVDGYAANLPSYRATDYVGTSQTRLEDLLTQIASDPTKLADNLDELFDRVTIAKLNKLAD